MIKLGVLLELEKIDEVSIRSSGEALLD